jgi:hypothetical protein
MKALSTPSRLAFLFFCSGAAFFQTPGLRAEDLVAVASKVSNGYVRTELPDGSFAPETYAFKEGGFLGNRMADDTIDKMSFASVVREISGPLASKNFVASAEPRDAKLLIVVYWGTSRAQAEFSSHTTIGQRMEQDSPSSGSAPALPGYDAFKDNWQLLQARGQAFADKMINEEDAMQLGYQSATDPELREYRYFVVLLAYDLQEFLKDRKEKLLWQTRFSLNEHRSRFDLQLKAMALVASVYFGRDSLGLRHGTVPEGHVEIGEVKSLDAIPNPNTSAVLSPDGEHVAYLTKGKNGWELTLAGISQPDVYSAGAIPESSGGLVQLAWLDSGHIVVKLPSSEILAFNCRGKHVEFDPRKIGSSFGGFSRALEDNSSTSQIQAIAQGKLPDRKVVLLASDDSRNRYLLMASDKAGAGRFFVYDRPTDLLYEIGRSQSTQ